MTLEARDMGPLGTLGDTWTRGHVALGDTETTGSVGLSSGPRSSGATGARPDAGHMDY